jgi:hypothetical protein
MFRNILINKSLACPKQIGFLLSQNRDAGPSPD